METEITLPLSQQPFVPILNQIGYVCDPTRYFFRNHSDILLPSISERSLSLTIPHQIVYIFLFSPIRSTRTAHLFPHLKFQKQFRDKYKSSWSLCNFFPVSRYCLYRRPKYLPRYCIFFNKIGQFLPQWKLIVKCISLTVLQNYLEKFCSYLESVLKKRGQIFKWILTLSF